MGHSRLHLAMIMVGAFTMGAAFVGAENRAEASLECEPTLIVAEPVSACTEFQFHDDMTVECLDDGRTYDVDHYMVEADTDGEGFYLGVWE